MELAFVTHAAYLTAAIIFALLGFIYSWQVSKQIVHWSLATACFVNVGFFLAVGVNADWLSGHSQLALSIELLRYVAWIFAIVATLRFLVSDDLPKNLKRLIYASVTASCFIIAWAAQETNSANNTAYILSWSALLLSIASLISLEQLFKNIDQNRQIKLLCLCLGATFAYDIYLFSHSLTYSGIDPQLWQSRAVIAVATGSVMLLGALTLNPQNSAPSKLSLSRPIAFYTTSVTASGLFITVLGLGGYYVRDLGGYWGTVLYTLFFFVTLMGIAILFISSSARDFVSVLINKHFFSHKYDYRNEWLKLIKTLSLPTLPGQVK